MSERYKQFTERARKVIIFAGEEARRLGDHETIKPPHFILGIIAEGDGLAMKVLANLGVTIDRLRLGAEALLSSQRAEMIGHNEVGLSNRGKMIISLTVDEARSLGHHYMGTEHLLLALLRGS